MDSFTLSLVIFVFFSTMVIYFVSTQYGAPPPAEHVATQNIPTVLRHNVAIARLMKMERKRDEMIY